LAPELRIVHRGMPLLSIGLADSATVVEGRCGLEELSKVAFEVQAREAGQEYRLTLGDEELLPDADLGTIVAWKEHFYFESCVGEVHVRLFARHEGETWVERARLGVFVTPEKLRWDEYHRILSDLRSVAAGLIFELVSRIGQQVGFEQLAGGIHSVSANLELRKAQWLWNRVNECLAAIEENPVTTTGRRRRLVVCQKGDAVDTAAYVFALGQGIDARSRTGMPWFRAPSYRRVRSHRTNEHRIIRAVLEVVLRNLKECGERAQRQIGVIQAERPIWLGEKFAREKYDPLQAPRIKMLRDVLEQSRSISQEIRQSLQNHTLRDCDAAKHLAFTPVFQHVPPYQSFWVSAIRYLRDSYWILEEGPEERIKRTSQLYEYWVFVQILAAFNHVGLRGEAWTGLFRQRGRERFTLDLDKNTSVVFTCPDGWSVRVRYEPVVKPKHEGIAQRDSIYFPAPRSVRTPDVVIEICRPMGGTPEREVFYAAVIDSKYSRSIDDRKWDEVRDYLSFRATASDRQVVKQLWLAFPSETGVQPLDSAVNWGDEARTEQLGETVQGTLGLMPPPAEHEENGTEAVIPASAALDFVRGLLTYVRGKRSPWYQ
jgi:hypothetical protein